MKKIQSALRFIQRLRKDPGFFIQDFDPANLPSINELVVAANEKGHDIDKAALLQAISIDYKMRWKKYMDSE